MISEKVQPDFLQLLYAFIEAVKDDPRISAVHISLYVALLYQWKLKDFEHPLSVFSYDIMPTGKISGPATYHRAIKELAAYRYIRYTPSYNHFLGSLVEFIAITEHSMIK